MHLPCIYNITYIYIYIYIYYISVYIRYTYTSQQNHSQVGDILATRSEGLLEDSNFRSASNSTADLTAATGAESRIHATKSHRGPL